LFFVLPFAWWLGCAGLFAWAYRSRAWLRRDVAHNGGLFSVAAAFGSAQWILGELLVFRDYRWGLGRALLVWLVEIAVAAPLLIWAIREFHPRGHVVAEEPPPMTVGVHVTARDGGYRRIVGGLALLVPSVYGIRWLFTDPNAGYLMILWVVLFFAEAVAAMIGASLVLAGIGMLRGLPVRKSVGLGPIFLVGGAMLMILVYVLGHP
jgi:hypothetical protein